MPEAQQNDRAQGAKTCPRLNKMTVISRPEQIPGEFKQGVIIVHGSQDYYTEIYYPGGEGGSTI
jgi:hypothetical protein